MEENQAIVCLVGDNIRKTPGVGGAGFRGAERDQRADDFARRVAAEYQPGGGRERPARAR